MQLYDVLTNGDLNDDSEASVVGIFQCLNFLFKARKHLLRVHRCVVKHHQWETFTICEHDVSHYFHSGAASEHVSYMDKFHKFRRNIDTLCGRILPLKIFFGMETLLWLQETQSFLKRLPTDLNEPTSRYFFRRSLNAISPEIVVGLKKGLKTESSKSRACYSPEDMSSIYVAPIISRSMALQILPSGDPIPWKLSESKPGRGERSRGASSLLPEKPHRSEQDAPSVPFSINILC